MAEVKFNRRSLCKGESTMTEVNAKMFRVGSRDEVKWNGENIDNTPSGIQLIDIPEPRKDDIDVADPDTPTQSATVIIGHKKNFRLIVRQDSKLEAGVALLPRLGRIPGLFSGGGVTAVSGELAKIIRELITKVDLSVTGTATVKLYRNAKDGGGFTFVKGVADTVADAEVSKFGETDVNFIASTRVTSVGGANNYETDTSGQSKQVTAGSDNFIISDGTYMKLPPVTTGKFISISVTLQALIDPIVSQDNLNKYIDDIKKSLRSVGAVSGVGDNEKINSPQRKENETDASFAARAAAFGANILGALQAVLNAILESVKQRVVAALIVNTTLLLEIDSDPPQGVKDALAFFQDVEPIEKPGADFVIDLVGERERETSTVASPRLTSLRITENRPLSSEASLNANDAVKETLDRIMRTNLEGN
jgi:hypothetical protein